MIKSVGRSRPLRGEITVEADKSISHRSVIFAALAQGQSRVENFLLAEDTLCTCDCLRQLGIGIRQRGSVLTVEGQGLNGLTAPRVILYCGNSGTTMRLMCGVLAAQSFHSMLGGDDSLHKRPMKRVIDPLTLMGADIIARNRGTYAPLAINGRQLKGIQYKLPVASAQIKSAILLAGLYARGETVVIEPQKSRDHTERMLASMGADLKIADLQICIKPGRELMPQNFVVPGDISSAAFFMVAASIIPGSELIIKNVGVNPTRSGIIDVLLAMGGSVKLENQHIVGGEPIADIVVASAALQGTIIEGEIIPRLIDELPVLAVAMAVAQGQSIVKDAGELRVKETDRISAICMELSKMGVDIVETDNGFIVNGRPEGLAGASVNSHGDHRIAMSLAVAGLAARGETVIDGAEAVSISFPGFWDLLAVLGR
ncbi:MAG: 3-phosphoshikimate 1-carboxyvinyltransferase [Syntrophomonadaceae bacterium]|jgi:3-phosphoshikimate 1-carboxyvinyltransferase